MTTTTADTRPDVVRAMLAELRNGLLRGTFGDYGLLPGEAELVSRHGGTARDARRALGEVLVEGLAWQRPGHGVVAVPVRHWPLDKHLRDIAVRRDSVLVISWERAEEALRDPQGGLVKPATPGRYVATLSGDAITRDVHRPSGWTHQELARGTGETPEAALAALVPVEPVEPWSPDDPVASAYTSLNDRARRALERAQRAGLEEGLRRAGVPEDGPFTPEIRRLYTALSHAAWKAVQTLAESADREHLTVDALGSQAFERTQP